MYQLFELTNNIIKVNESIYVNLKYRYQILYINIVERV